MCIRDSSCPVRGSRQTGHPATEISVACHNFPLLCKGYYILTTFSNLFQTTFRWQLCPALPTARHTDCGLKKWGTQKSPCQWQMSRKKKCDLTEIIILIIIKPTNQPAGGGTVLVWRTPQFNKTQLQRISLWQTYPLCVRVFYWRGFRLFTSNNYI